MSIKVYLDDFDASGKQYNFKSLANWLFVQQFVHANSEEDMIAASYYWSFVKGIWHLYITALLYEDDLFWLNQKEKKTNDSISGPKNACIVWTSFAVYHIQYSSYNTHTVFLMLCCDLSVSFIPVDTSDISYPNFRHSKTWTTRRW